MYVDESGDHVMDPSKWSSPDARYLGLTGVVIASGTYCTRTHSEFEALKQEFFPYDPDEPLVLVRNQIVGKRNLFQILRDPEVAAHWEDRITRFFNAHVSQIITVVLDKEAYLRSSPIPALRPYSYCMNALTERYGQWLNEVGGTGDVMTESRGRREDRELKGDFRRFMTESANLPDVQELRRSVSSNQIKLNLKTDNITGLQLATCWPTHRKGASYWKTDFSLTTQLARQPSVSLRQSGPGRITAILYCRKDHKQKRRPSPPLCAIPTGWPPPATWIARSISPFYTRNKYVSRDTF